MRKTPIAVLALCALAALAGRADDPEPPADGKAELKKLRGKWVVTRQVVGGRDRPLPEGLYYTFDGDRLTRSTPTDRGRGVKEKRFRVKVSTRKKPHTIELIPEGCDEGQVCIFKLEKSELHLAMGGPKDKAPVNFRGDAGALVVLRKEAKKARE
jgi:uncharacterized protein (TIGR03067 family)